MYKAYTSPLASLPRLLLQVSQLFLLQVSQLRVSSNSQRRHQNNAFSLRWNFTAKPLSFAWLFQVEKMWKHIYLYKKTVPRVKLERGDVISSFIEKPVKFVYHSTLIHKEGKSKTAYPGNHSCKSLSTGDSKGYQLRVDSASSLHFLPG